MTVLNVQLERVADESRRYYPDQDISVAGCINWDRPPDSFSDEIPLDDTDVSLGVALLAIEGIAGITVWPRCLQVRIDKLIRWEAVEPRVLGALATQTGATETQLTIAPNDPSQL